LRPSVPRRALQRIVVRTAYGPLSPVWRIVYAAVLRSAAGLIARAGRGTAVYVKGSLAGGDPLFGLSDIDLVAVVETDPVDARAAAGRVAARWRRLVRAFPPLGYLVFLFVYDERDLARAVSAPCLTFGLGDDPDGAAFLGSAPLVDELGLQERPGLYGTSDWRRIAGPDRRPQEPRHDAQDARIAAWLEIQFLSRYLFAACARPDAPHVPRLCVKLVADPARVLLKLVHNEDVRNRTEALACARHRFPEHARRFTFALELQRRLDRQRVPPLREALDAFLELASAIADELERQAESAGSLTVELDGDRELKASSLPLVDWRAVVVSADPDESFAVVSADVADPEQLGTIATAADRGTYSALRHRNLLILPAASRGVTGRDDVRIRSASFNRVKLRGIQCRVTDPVSFALVGGAGAAAFPHLRGWSASDIARRAVAEHGAWLRLPAGRGVPQTRPWIGPQQTSDVASADVLGRLLAAARAGLFSSTLTSSTPELPLTLAAIGRALRDAVPRSGSLGLDAVEAYQAARASGEPPPARLVLALRDAVVRLGPYANHPPNG
jgi:predicted nucleotidyltransferase